MESGPTEAALNPVGGNTARGRAQFLTKPNATVLQIRVTGLEPAAKERRYVVWLLSDRQDMMMLAELQVGKEGEITRGINTVESHAVVESGEKDVLLITRVGNIDRVRQGIAETGGWDPPLIGEPVVRGTLEGPLVGSMDTN